MCRAALLFCGLTFACAKGAPPPATGVEEVDERADREPGKTPQAAADLDARSGSKVDGELSFFAVDGGVRIEGMITGLTPSAAHGFHIHEVGDCSAPDAASAGPHYNPTQMQHGAPGASSHVGDLGNIQSDAAGNAVINVVAGNATLGGGEHDLVGKSVVVHAKPDDLQSQPSGQSGDRVACGVIKGK